MIDEVLTNLMENAVKYTPAGSALDIHILRTDGAQQLRVVDHGPGIPELERDRVFDKFYRLRRKGAASGSGLGLAVCKGFVEAHDGRIWIENTPGGGATFCIEIPAHAPRSADQLAEPQAART
jgi:two-component system sensor histidine kinase KdpD